MWWFMLVIPELGRWRHKINETLSQKTLKTGDVAQ
jgi:hypothetical protein